MNRSACVLCVFVIVSFLSSSLPLQAQNCPDLISKVSWGPTISVAVDGDLAFLGETAQIRVVNISDPSAPTPIGAVELPGPAKTIVVVGNLAYVSCDLRGLVTIDVSDPTNPVIISTYVMGWHIDDLVVSNGHAFVAAGWTMQIIDLSDPAQPKEVAVHIADMAINGIEVDEQNDLAFLALGFEDHWQPSVGQVLIVDVSTPSAPVNLGSVVLSDVRSIRDLTLSGDFVAVLDWGSLHAVDVSDPTAPAEVANIIVSAGASRIVADNDYLYLPGESEGLWLVDFSDPGQPSVASTLQLQGRPLDVAIGHGHAWVAAEDGDLRVVNLDDKNAPVEVGSYDTLDQSRGATVYENHAYVLDENIQVFDISNQLAPVQVSNYSTPGKVNDIQFAGGLAFVAESGGGLRILDISDPSAISEVSSVIESGTYALRLKIIENLVYVTYLDRGLVIYDVTDPSAPVELSAFRGAPGRFPDLSIAFWDLAIVRDTVYIPVWQAGLWTVDVSDPTAPVDLDLKTDIDGNTLATNGDFLFVIGGWTLHTLDISNSRWPQLVNTYQTAKFPTSARSMFIAGDLLFLSPELNVVDVSDPLDPIWVPTDEAAIEPTIMDVIGSTAIMVGDGFALADITHCGNYLSYTTWVEIAASLDGEGGSKWNTDVVARNQSAHTADIEFELHHENGSNTATGSIPPGAQGVFVDIVETIMAGDAKGALEIRSNRPLQVSARIYNSSVEGSFGQFVAGHPEDSGMDIWDLAWLLQLRQQEGEFRSNISVTNGGEQDARVKITLYSTDAVELTNFDLELVPGELIQELQPFKNRAGMPNLGWGFARVEVLRGYKVFCSASVVDSRTNDATTIPMIKESIPK